MNEDNNKISEITRRNIMDAVNVSNIPWNGRLDEPTFLGRLYNLEGMPSYDHRFKTAWKDIWKHTVVNSDWDQGWFFADPRFNVFHAPDKDFLKFLCETVHPIVRPDAEDVTALLVIYNENLAADGWELAEQLRLSGKPVFAARRRLVGSSPALASAKAVAETLNADYMARQITRMETATDSDPELAIGTAKEFAETVCKTILREKGVTLTGNEDFHDLVRRAKDQMKLIPSDAMERAKGTKTVERLLSNLAEVARGLSELRGLYGSGHGKEANVKGLESRHARLAVGAATALAVFLFECHKESG